MPFICLNFASMTKQNSLVILKDIIMIVSNANVSGCLGFEHCTLVRLRHLKMRIIKALDRLRGCAGWSAPLLFENHRRQVFSRRGPYGYGYILSKKRNVPCESNGIDKSLPFSFTGIESIENEYQNKSKASRQV